MVFEGLFVLLFIHIIILKPSDMSHAVKIILTEIRMVGGSVQGLTYKFYIQVDFVKKIKDNLFTSSLLT